PRQRLRLQVLELTLLRAAPSLPGTVGATPTGRNWATSAPDAHRDNSSDVSPPRTPGSSSTAASGPATAASGFGAAPGAFGSHCSCTPPHCWPAPWTTARATPGGTL